MAKRRSATVVERPSPVEHVGRLERLGEPRAERQDRDLLALAHDPALADLEPLGRLGQRDAGAVAARIADRDRPGIVQRGGVDHVDQLGLVGRRHHHEIGQGGEIGDVEAAGMGRAVGADQPGPVDREAHRQILDRDVVHHLIVGALQEGRIDRAEGPHALRGEAGGEGHRMLLGDADVEHAVGEFARRTCRARCPDGIAAVIATIFSSRSASAISALANTPV